VNSTISDQTKKKLQLYTAACYLFNAGNSHPQIIEILEKHEPDNQALTLIVDKAMHEDWDKLFQKSRQLFNEGKIYAEVLAYTEEKEPDKEIAKWICGEWYEWKLRYMEMIVESPTNIMVGSKWVIICGIVIPILFWMKASIITKGIWIFFFTTAFLLWVLGIQQKRFARRIDNLFKIDDENEE
jgi:hypothetical protein